MATHLLEHIQNQGENHINEIDGIYLALKSNLKDSDITTIVPAKDRPKQLRSTLLHLIASANSTDQKVAIVVVEISPSMEHLHVCRDLGVSYVWVHQLPDRKFNKCLAHNLGYCFTNSKILHFHDSDIIMEPQFYELFKGYKMTEISVLHCLREKYVRYLTPEESDTIFEGKTIKELLVYANPPIPENKKAPGGSIAIGRFLFELIGGFDAHLFEGYSAEDQFFWDKVANIVLIPSMNDNDMFHIHHDAERSHPNGDHLESLKAFEVLKNKGEYYEAAKGLLMKLKAKVNGLQGV